MPDKSKILPVPDQNHFYCYQNNELNGYEIKNHKKERIYLVIGKTAATRSHYRVTRDPYGVALATIDQDQVDNKYTISDEHDNDLSIFRVKDNSEVELTIGETKLRSAVLNRGKQFEFKNEQDQIELTVDKKLIALNDTYKISFVEEFPALIAALLPVIIDDFYHLGTTN